MSPRHMGVRIPHTCRIPVNLHRSLVGGSIARGWSLNMYIVHLLEKGVDDMVAPEVGVEEMKQYDNEGARL